MRTLMIKYGDLFCSFKELNFGGVKKSETPKLYIQAISRKAGNIQSGVPVVFEISEGNVDINIFRHTTSGTNLIPCYGFSIMKNSNKMSQ